MLKKILLTFFLFAISLINAYSYIQVSLLTSTPSDDEVYTVWGHTALRVRTDSTDIVYNYGVFEFGEGFVFKFVRGETDYWLEKEPMQLAKVEAVYKNVDLYEQMLSLTESEAKKVYEKLEQNALPENRSYRYNFFYDNCATRPRDLLEQAIGQVSYPVWNNKTTYREEIHQLTRNCPWLQFGIDLCLGSKTDEVVDDYALLFLPRYMREAYEHAKKSDGTDLVRMEYRVVTALPVERAATFPPLLVFLLLLFCITLLTWLQDKRRMEGKVLDAVVFFTFGMVGVLLFFLTFFSSHPCVSPNFNLLWAHPLQLAIVPLLFVRKYEKVMRWLFLLNLAGALVVLVGWFLIPQWFHVANLPLVLISVERSVFVLKRTAQKSVEKL